MLKTDYIVDLKADRLPPNIGNKAKSLRFLAKHGFRTPATYVCTWDAYRGYLADDHGVIEQLRTELAHALDLRAKLAIRSSANIEDGLDFSFAGQFKSVLDVQGLENILQAIWSVWVSSQSSSAQAYLARHGIDPRELQMAVLLQEMVDARVSGVAFSKNPITGLDEIVVEAVQGSGERLVQEGVTPSRWINKWGAWVSEPDTGGIDRGLIQRVVEGTKAIAKAYGRAVDLEWVYDGHALYWVQLREISASAINVYSNHISKEVFPGLVKPLVWSVNVPLVNGAWVKLFTELVGPNDIDPGSLAKSFYCRAYFNMGAIGRLFELLGMPRETLELLMGIELGGPDKPSFKPSPKTYRLLPRLLRVVLDKIRFERQLRAFIPAAWVHYERMRVSSTAGLSELQLLAGIERLYDLTQETAYYNIVTPLLLLIYHRILTGQLRRAGIDLERFDLTQGLDKLAQFEPNVHLARLNQAFATLPPPLQTRVRASRYDELRQWPEAGAFLEHIDRFIAGFGHLSDSGNDFSSVPWREQPDLVLKMALNYEAREERAPDKVGFDALPMSLGRRLLLRPIYARARRFRLHREAVSSLYTFGYGLFRDRFLALGERLAQRGVLATADDIFYLRFDEVRAVVAAGASESDLQPQITQRKVEMEASRHLRPPDVIYGDDAPPVESHTGDRLSGTPTSRGYYTGPARVVRGLRDFDKLAEGDVLIIPFSDVGWTPLFIKAGAVVAESGGILSHSSIVAREYNIPAVVSVSGACQLSDDTLVTVDGYRGQIVVHAPQAAA